MILVSEQYLLSTFGYESIIFFPWFFQHAAYTLPIDHVRWDLGFSKCPPHQQHVAVGPLGTRTAWTRQQKLLTLKEETVFLTGIWALEAMPLLFSFLKNCT